MFGGNASLADLVSEDGVTDGRIDLTQVGPGKGLRIDGVTLNAGDNSVRSVAMVGTSISMVSATCLLVPFGPTRTVLITVKPLLLTSCWEATGFFCNEWPRTHHLAHWGIFRFDGVSVNDSTAAKLSALGDLIGDGLTEFVISASRASPNGSLIGAAYVVFGCNAYGSNNDLSALDGSDGFRLEGLGAGDLTGVSVGAAGDVNGDGFDDILVGAPSLGRPGSPSVGAVFIVFGKAAGFDPSINLGELDGDSGFRIEGVHALQSGQKDEQGRAMTRSMCRKWATTPAISTSMMSPSCGTGGWSSSTRCSTALPR